MRKILNKRFAPLITLCMCALCLSTTSCVFSSSKSTAIRQTRSDNANPLRAEVTTHLGDKATFIKGDEIKFLLSLSQNSYVLLLYQDAQRQLWQLFPNRMRKEKKMPAGDFLSFPSHEDGIKITVGPPYGNEQVLLFASDKPLPELVFIKSANGMRLLKEDLPAVERDISENSKKHAARLTHAATTIKTAAQ